MKNLTFFLSSLCLSIAYSYGQPLSMEEELVQFRNNIKSLRARMDALQERYHGLGIKIGNKHNQSINLQNTAIQNTSETPPVSTLENKAGEETFADDSVLDNEVPVEYTKSIGNSLRFSYAICIPHDTGYGNYNLEYDTGHSIGLSYNRNYNSFFWGLELGAKFFENKKITNLPTWLPQNFQSIFSKPKGNNYSTNLSLLSGIKHGLTEKLYFQGNLGVGISYSWDEIQLGSTTVEYNEANFYGACNLGVGLRFSELTSLLLFYQIDAHGDSGNLDSRVFSQVGLNLGIHY